jgi:hypothetical protein
VIAAASGLAVAWTPSGMQGSFLFLALCAFSFFAPLVVRTTAFAICSRVRQPSSYLSVVLFEEIWHI